MPLNTETEKKNFYKSKLCIVWNWFMAKIIFIVQNYLCLIKMLANQARYSRLEHDPVINFSVAKKCKAGEIYRRMCTVHGEEYFRLKMFTNRLNLFCHNKHESKRQFME